MGNLSRDSYQLRLNNIQRVNPPTDSEGARTKLEEGDILISITGEVGLLGLIPPNFGDAYINQHICLVRPMDELKNRYLPEFFRSPFAQNQFNRPQRGLKNSFRLTDVTGLLVPLPPLTEQYRLVAKVDELMALCDRLEAQLITIEADSRYFLEAILDQALGTTSYRTSEQKLGPTIRDAGRQKRLDNPLSQEPRLPDQNLHFMNTTPVKTIAQMVECLIALGGTATPERLLNATGLGDDVDKFFDLLREGRNSGLLSVPTGSNQMVRRIDHAD